MNLKLRLAALTILIALAGCETSDQQLVDFAEEANQQQARQSEQVARQSREIASAAHNLIEQDAAARRELLEAQARHQEQFREQQVIMDQQRQQLHAERREAAQAAVREPVIAQALIAAALILAALLPLLVTAYALRRLPETGATEELLADALLEDIAAIPSASSAAFPSEPRLADSTRPGLPPDQR
ncbi:MAG: hypothetical protein L0219_21080 [Phycisphaerales bacterium]|nr:hypothetical protein [Phycisphaerales bacterium]